MEDREGCPQYMFYDGPPTANGKPHIGHVLTRVIKDMIPRYRTMKGYEVPRKAGWDTHGLPVELEVEKALGLDGKDQIEKHGRYAVYHSQSAVHHKTYTVDSPHGPPYSSQKCDCLPRISPFPSPGQQNSCLLKPSYT